MSEWRDISTAPRDGTMVLLYIANPRGMGNEDEDRYKLAFFGIGDDWYESEASGLSVTELHGSPTHWAPLPTPPAAL